MSVWYDHLNTSDHWKLIINLIYSSLNQWLGQNLVNGAIYSQIVQGTGDQGSIQKGYFNEENSNTGVLAGYVWNDEIYGFKMSQAEQYEEQGVTVGIYEQMDRWGRSFNIQTKAGDDADVEALGLEIEMRTRFGMSRDQVEFFKMQWQQFYKQEN